MSIPKKLPFHLSNTLTRKKEEFVPLNPPHVGLYVCGPTVYSDVHLGNVRSFTTFDVLYRWLTHIGYKVRYVRNITDVGHLVDDVDAGEDKIAKRARLEQLEPMWEELFPAEQARLVQLLVERVTVGPTGADIKLRVDGLSSLVRDLRGSSAMREAA